MFRTRLDFTIGFVTLNPMKEVVLDKILSLLILGFWIHMTSIQAQDPKRFQDEVQKLDSTYSSRLLDEPSVVFTGSSSIRKWETLEKDLDDLSLINTGFGGSHMSDLLYYLDELVINYQPKKVFIYEGDNDVAFGTLTDSILWAADQVAQRIHQLFPTCEIYFLAAKPSPARWSFTSSYHDLNTALRNYCDRNERLHYIDVWTPLLNASDYPESDFYVADSLHLSDQGYAVWTKIIEKYLAE